MTRCLEHHALLNLVWSVKQFDGVKDEVGAQEVGTRATRDDLDSNGIGASLEGASRNKSIVYFTESTVSSPRNTPRVNLDGSIEGLLEATDGDLRATTCKCKSGTDTKSGLGGDGRGEIKLDSDWVVDGLEDGHGKVTSRTRAYSVGERTPTGHALVTRMHAQLVGSVKETLGLAIPIANTKDRGVLSSGNVGVGGDRRRSSTAGRDAHALRGNLELTLVENLSVSSRHHEWRGESTVGRSVGPVLKVFVEPMHNTLEARLNTSGGTTHSAAGGVGGVVRDRKILEEGHVNILSLWNTRS